VEGAGYIAWDQVRECDEAFDTFIVARANAQVVELISGRCANG
jgi:hypothetical protein